MCSVERVKGACVSPANPLPELVVVSQFSSPYCYSGLAPKRFIFTSYFLHSALALVVESPEAKKEDRKLVKGAKRETPPVLNRRRLSPTSKPTSRSSNAPLERTCRFYIMVAERSDSMIIQRFSPPALSTVQLARLPKDALVEIEVIGRL